MDSTMTDVLVRGSAAWHSIYSGAVPASVNAAKADLSFRDIVGVHNPAGGEKLIRNGANTAWIPLDTFPAPGVLDVVTGQANAEGTLVLNMNAVAGDYLLLLIAMGQWTNELPSVTGYTRITTGTYPDDSFNISQFFDTAVEGANTATITYEAAGISAALLRLGPRTDRSHSSDTAEVPANGIYSHPGVDTPSTGELCMHALSSPELTIAQAALIPSTDVDWIVAAELEPNPTFLIAPYLRAYTGIQTGPAGITLPVETQTSTGAIVRVSATSMAYIDDA